MNTDKTLSDALKKLEIELAAQIKSSAYEAEYLESSDVAAGAYSRGFEYGLRFALKSLGGLINA